MPISTQPIEDWGDAIFLAMTNAINTFWAALPAVIGAIVILIIGWILSSIAARIVTRALKATGVDRMFASHGGSVYGPEVRRFEPSVIAGEVVKWAIRLVFLTAAANALGMPQVSALLNQVLLWIPNLVVAAVVLLVAPLLGRFVGGTIEAAAGGMGFTNGHLLGQIAQYAIMAFAVVIAINQVGIGAGLVNVLFTGVVAAMALAFGLAFGLGGRDVAAELTRSWYASSQEAAERIREHTATDTAPAPAAAPRSAARRTTATTDVGPEIEPA